MKIKRKEYKRLLAQSQELSDLKHVTLIIRTHDSSYIHRELLRTNLVTYVQKNTIPAGQLYTWSKSWFTGPIQFEFIKEYSGYEYFLMNKGYAYYEFVLPSETGAGSATPGVPGSLGNLRGERTVSERPGTVPASPGETPVRDSPGQGTSGQGDSNW